MHYQILAPDELERRIATERDIPACPLCAAIPHLKTRLYANPASSSPVYQGSVFCACGLTLSHNAPTRHAAQNVALALWSRRSDAAVPDPAQAALQEKVAEQAANYRLLRDTRDAAWYGAKTMLADLPEFAGIDFSAQPFDLDAAMRAARAKNPIFNRPY